MARKQFERQGIRTPSGGLATGVEFVVYTDEAATVLADISATSGGSAIAGSTVTVAEIVGLGPASLRFWGPTDDTAVLYLRCPAAPSLGIQEVEAEPEAGGGGVTDHGALTGLADDDHPQYATDTDLTTHAGAADPHTGYVLESAHTLAAHDALLLATDAELTTHAGAANPHSVYALDTDLSTHEADTTAIHGITDTSALATTSGVTSAVSTHAGLADPHTGYVLESLVDAKGDIIAASAADTVARLAVGADGTVLKAASGQATGLQWAAETAHPNLATHDGLGLATDAELTTHAGAADPHAGYVLESLYDAKGDLIAASADNTPAKLTVGANDTVLTADSAQSAGVKWATPATQLVHALIIYGPAAIGVGIGQRLYFNRAATLVSARVSVGTAPTGASLNCQVTRDRSGAETTIEQLNIAAAAFTAFSSSLDATDMQAGDFIFVWVQQVGSGAPGSDVTLDVEYR